MPHKRVHLFQDFRPYDVVPLSECQIHRGIPQAGYSCDGGRRIVILELESSELMGTERTGRS